MTWRKKTLLLTGGSGVLGRALIDEFAHDFDIVCLRNRRSIADPRISEFAGDFSHPTLGLDDDDYAQLTRRVDAIVHSAAVTSWKEDPTRIRETNLAGPTALLRLAANADAPLYFFSTAFVANPPDDGDSFPGAATYVQSKIDAEELVRTHSAETVIVRPSVVSGSTIDGSMAAFQGLHRVMGSIVRGLVPLVPCTPDSLIDTIPQDLVARALGDMVRARVAGGEYWLTAGDNALHANDFLELCYELAEEIGNDVVRPRLVASESVDRLLLPLIEETMPRATHQMFRDFLEFMWLFQSPAPLPSSMAELGFAEAVSRDALRAATRKSLRYWARTKRLLRPEDAARVA